MGWRDWFARAEAKASKVGALLVTSPGQPAWSNRDYAAFADEGYRRNVIAYQCVRRIAESVASVQWTAWRGETELSESPFLDLLAKPNPGQSGDEYVIATISYLMIAGNRYDERIMVGSEPRELYTLRPDRMKVVPGGDGYPLAYVYAIGGQTRRWDVDPGTMEADVRHDKLFNPLDDWYGMSPIEAGAYSIDTHNDNLAMGKALLQNGARPGGALQTEDDLTAEQFNRLKAQVETQFSGAANAGRPMLLESGMKWQPMAFSPSDMDALESRYASARDICLAFGVPPLLMGVKGDNTFANYAEARLAFWEDTVIPLVDRLANDWSMWLGPYFGDQIIKADLDQIPAIADKRKTLWDMADKATDLTINERRELKGYKPLPEGDVLLVSAGQIGLADALSMDDGLPADMTADDIKAMAYGEPREVKGE